MQALTPPPLPLHLHPRLPPWRAAGRGRVTATTCCDAFQDAPGRPVISDLFSSAHCIVARRPRVSVQRALCTRGITRRMLSFQALWNLRSGVSPSSPFFVGSSWGALRHCAPQHLMNIALTFHISTGFRLAIWSPRRPVPRGRSVIRRRLAANRVVQPQETHLPAVDAAFWEVAFRTAAAIHAPTRPGPRGGAQGGARHSKDLRP